MADYQLQQGLNTGLQSFWDAFKDERNRSQDLEYKKAALAQEQAKIKHANTLEKLKRFGPGYLSSEEKSSLGLLNAPQQEQTTQSAMLQPKEPASLLGGGSAPTAPIANYNKSSQMPVEPNYKFPADSSEGKEEREAFIRDLNKYKTMSELQEMPDKKKKHEQDLTKGAIDIKKSLHDLRSSEKKETPEGRLEASGADVKTKIGFANEGLKAAKNIEDLLNKGATMPRINPSTSLIGGFVGSDPLYEQMQVLAEQYGRLQSGGAINKDEEARFMARGPRPGDSKEAAIRKIQQMQDELKSKMALYGATPEVLSGVNSGGETGQKLTPEQRDAIKKQLGIN